MVDFSEKLKAARKEAGLSQADVADSLGCSRQAYAHYETGRNEPSLEMLSKIASILKCSVDYLLGLVDTPKQFDLTPEQREAYHKAAAEMPGRYMTDEELAAKLPENVREGMMALIRLERDKHNKH